MLEERGQQEREKRKYLIKVGDGHGKTKSRLRLVCLEFIMECYFAENTNREQGMLPVFAYYRRSEPTLSKGELHWKREKELMGWGEWVRG